MDDGHGSQTSFAHHILGSYIISKIYLKYTFGELNIHECMRGKVSFARFLPGAFLSPISWLGSLGHEGTAASEALRLKQNSLLWFQPGW